MARIMILTKNARGKAICSKCGKEIIAREKYNKAIPYRREPIIRCLACGIKPYEASGSSYVRTASSLVNRWRNIGFVYDGILDEVTSDVEDLKYDIEYNLNNLPEQFQDGSILQNRLDSLEDCLNELESIDDSFYYDMDEDDEDYDEREFKMCESQLKSEIDSALSNILLR